ncbi:hypothetical protein [Streptomyces sp. NPDC048338]|uniref:hypothetical protein n=1 Tax=Streptomyces sp. NPDC048338 TaxID=3365536 RepID=UPI0037228B1E
MQKTALEPYARLPRAHHGRHVLAATVDDFGVAHWLLVDRPSRPGGDPKPYDALVVSVGDGGVEVTELNAVHARWPLLDRLPDGGFVLAAARDRGADKQRQVQVFDALGRQTWSFGVGDAIEHLLVDATGELWVGHFDENPVGIRRWSATGERRWTSGSVPGAGWIMDCYALNVAGSVAWACPYTDFPLLEIRPGEPVRVRANSLRGAHGLAVHADRVAFVGGYGEDRDRVRFGALTETTVEPAEVAELTRPDGGSLGRRRIVCRGSRVYVLEEPSTEWAVFDIGG